ncbi:MAG: Uma2 family endonuclease [Solirubrobacterales bacterium]|nr:Uma2 family endonuclease [Solirubrobacterales bacterium]
MATPPIESFTPLHRISVADFQRMGELGMFDENQRVELVEGVLVDMMPVGLEHVRGVIWLTRWFDRRVPDHLIVSGQNSVVLPGLISQLQPDVALVRFDDLVDSLPETPPLVVEVSYSSLRYDRIMKARLYARHGVPEYWIVNLPEACVEVHREPEGDTYRSHTVEAAPCALALPEHPLDTDALFAFALRGER